MNPLDLIADIAASKLGTFETSPNQGPGLQAFWNDTNYVEGMKDREPWCCAFTVYCINEAEKQLAGKWTFGKPPQMAACSLFMEWANDPANGCLVFSPSSVVHGPAKGDIVCYLPHLSHIGIIAKDYDGTGFIHTIEGNTNGDGSREGDGVYAKQRRYSFAGSIIRLKATAKAA